MLLEPLLMLASAASAPATAAPVEQPAPRAALTEEARLFFAVQLEAATLSDGITAYGQPDRPLLPVGELCRLLDLDLNVDLAAGRLVGRVGKSASPVMIDLASRTGLIGGRSVRIGEGDVAVASGEIYFSPALLAEVIPARFVVDPEALTVTVEPTEMLPIQSRMERLARLRGLGGAPADEETVIRVASPYELFSPPAFDMTVQVGRDPSAGRLTTRYDLRAAGDLLYGGLEAYLGSDGRGQPAQARVSLERRSIDGRLLGPVGATRIGLGDVFSTPLPLGPRSVGGRGVSLTTAPLQQASIFDTIDLRGELPIGYDVELYVNDILRSGQREPSQGRYEFLDVPLVRGLNVIRIVSYGPRGDRSEAVRVVNVGSGQLQRGETIFDVSAIDAGRPLIDLDRSIGQTPGEGRRVTAGISHGLTETLTVTGGIADYVPLDGERRQMAAIGARTAIAGFAVQADAAVDRNGGAAAGVGVAGQAFGAAVVARHVEQRGGFVDENSDLSGSGTPARRHTEITIDSSVFELGNRVVPLSIRAMRTESKGGASSLLIGARASVTYGSVLLSGGVDYEHRSGLGGEGDRLGGVLAASTFLNYQWQLRAALDYGLLPAMDLRALTITADRALDDRLSVRFGVASIFDRPSSTLLQIGANLRLPFGDLAANADYEAVTGDFSFGLRFAAGLAYDPAQGRYRATPPGAAEGGSVAFEAFLDGNGNGRRDAAEPGLENVAVEGVERPVATGKDGRAFFVGTGNAPAARLSVGTDEIDAFYVNAPTGQIEYSPRPGKTLKLQYPVVPLGEVAVRVMVLQDGGPIGVSAVRLRLVRDGADPVEATSEFDGTVVFDGVPAGSYRVEFDPEQSARLGMQLNRSIQITVEPEGPPAPDQVVFVTFARPAGSGLQ